MHTITIPMSQQDLSHELRIALTGVLGMAEFLKQEPLNSEQKSYVDIIESSGRRILAITKILTEESEG